MTRFIADTLRDLGSDVRSLLRMVRRQPVHAGASTLTLGIGATTAMFAIVDARLRVLTGIGMGVVAFLAAGRLVSSLLYETPYADSRVLAGAVIPLLTVSMAVVYSQAKRLASVSPVPALREDISST